MELFQLRYFAEVARQKNITRAAEVLGIAQPALSQQMRNLEQELGVQLFIRSSRQTRLSPVGEVFYLRAQEVIERAEAARQTVANYSRLKAGKLVIASIPTLSACWLPERIRRFRRKYPEIELQLREESTSDVARLVNESVAEFGFLPLPVDQGMFSVQPLFTEPFLVLVPDTHALAKGKKVALRALEDEPFILYKGRVLTVMLEACRAAGFEPKVACESGELETVRALVQAGLGLAILPRLALSGRIEHTKTLRIVNPKLERTLGLIRRRGHVWSPAAEFFVRLCTR